MSAPSSIHRRANTGSTSSGTPTTPAGPSSVLLLKSGSDANLLPEPLRSPLKATIRDIDASGGVVGNYRGINGKAGSFYYNVETKELVDLKGLPGVTNSTQIHGMNDLGQLVGTEAARRPLRQP